MPLAIRSCVCVRRKRKRRKNKIHVSGSLFLPVYLFVCVDVVVVTAVLRQAQAVPAAATVMEYDPGHHHQLSSSSMMGSRHSLPPFSSLPPLLDLKKIKKEKKEKKKSIFLLLLFLNNKKADRVHARTVNKETHSLTTLQRTYPKERPIPDRRSTRTASHVFLLLLFTRGEQHLKNETDGPGRADRGLIDQATPLNTQHTGPAPTTKPSSLFSLPLSLSLLPCNDAMLTSRRHILYIFFLY